MHVTRKIIHKSRVLKMINQNYITLKEAAGLISLSYRQLRRLYKRYKEQGESALIHGLRGRTSNRRINAHIRREILAYYKENLPGYRPGAAVKRIASIGYAISRTTLQRWLWEEGLWQPKHWEQSRWPYDRQSRSFGETLCLYIHPGNWFEKQDSESCLISLIDCATGIIQSRMAKAGKIQGAMQVLGVWVQRYGIPMGICCESKYIYKSQCRPANGCQLIATKAKTAFYDSCNILGLEITVLPIFRIKDFLPENYSVYCGRLLIQFKAAKIHSLQEANELLDNGFTVDFNKHFADDPALLEDSHVRLREDNNLNDIICFNFRKTVSAGQKVEYKKRLFQIKKDNPVIPDPCSEVAVKEWLNGSVHILYNKKELNVQEIMLK